MDKRFYFIIFFSIIFLSACIPQPLQPNAGRVSIIYMPKMQFKNCKFVGKISSNDVHGDKLQFTWNLEQNLKLDDINFLKNEGARLNANVVVLERHKEFIERHRNGNKPSDISSHVILANAYFCPSESISRIGTDLSRAYEEPIITKTY